MPPADPAMNGTGTSRSLWMEAAVLPMAALERDEQADVCIVGAGIAGLTVAYYLVREGRSVIVVDQRSIGGGETARTTAHIVNALDDYYHHIEKLHGKDGARLAAASHSAAIEAVEQIVHEAGIQCDFRRVDGYLFPAREEDLQLLSDELDAARRAGLHVEEVKQLPLSYSKIGPALRFPRQAQFHPMKYLNGLAASFTGSDVRLYGGVHVRDVEDGDTVRIRTGRGPTITARVAVVATNTPVTNRVAIHTKQAAYRTYAVAAAIPSGSMTPMLLWDTEDPYHYVRVQQGDNGSDWLIVGGEDHKTGQALPRSNPHDALELWMRGRFPKTGKIGFKWSGQVMEPVDGLAFIGRNPGDSNVYVATGDSGNGMTHGTLAGILISDLIAGRANPWAKLYDPARKSLRSIGEFARENLNVVRQYSDLLTPGDRDSVTQVERGSGMVLRRGARKVAVYRDEQDNLYHLSAICTHLGCVVQWNEAEQSWDCPCHGSRFDRETGRVLNGPAARPLGPWDSNEPHDAPGEDRPIDNGRRPARTGQKAAHAVENEEETEARKERIERAR